MKIEKFPNYGKMSKKVHVYKCINACMYMYTCTHVACFSRYLSPFTAPKGHLPRLLHGVTHDGVATCKVKGTLKKSNTPAMLKRGVKEL